VRDEDDRQALAAQLGEVAEQLVDLLRHEDGGGLVEDEHLRPPEQHLRDLDPLALGDRQLLDQPVRAEAEAVALGHLAQPPLRGAGVEQDAAAARLAAEDDVLEDREVLGQHEVLVDHADAGGDRGGRGAEPRRLPAEEDLALVRLVHAVEGLHERRLAGAVLADERVDLAGADDEVDVGVRHHAGEPLGDAAQLDRRRAAVPHGPRALRGLPVRGLRGPTGRRGLLVSGHRADLLLEGCAPLAPTRTVGNPAWPGPPPWCLTRCGSSDGQAVVRPSRRP
jgi:hypothetical protein